MHVDRLQVSAILADVYLFCLLVYSVICTQGELGEEECEQALHTLFHVLFTMARMMVCGSGGRERGRGT